MKFLILCIVALIAICSARKLQNKKWSLLRSDSGFTPSEELGVAEQWGTHEQWGADEQWGNEEYWEPSEPISKPLQTWKEPVFVEKKVPVYVPVPVEHIKTVVKHHPVYIKEKPTKLVIRKITHFKFHH
ncbi:uncharacterized protein LOC116342531 [Contarinia nasturtii]|uniref:uncharacterized protein LOC116342531 n=1 Tax=Contarinia nasturtii TaxID=265458 RepID=UPI0012D45B50|nr:uncharacterized protein LOC116342531 [Contarinia nasturtii]